MNVNLKAPFYLAQLLIPSLKQKRAGRIVNISSIGVKYGGTPRSCPYTLSKAGLESLTLNLCKELAPYQVLVNAIRVGLTDTPLHGKDPRKNLSERISKVPLGRMATPLEISNFVLYLLSEESTFMTGGIHSLAGGE